MKKTFLALICGLCLFITISAYALTDNDINDAAQMLDAFYAVAAQGNFEAYMDFLSQRQRAEFEESLQLDPNVKKISILSWRLCKATVKQIEPLDDYELEAVVSVITPDMAQITEDIIRKMEAAGETAREDNFSIFLAHMLKRLESGEFNMNEAMDLELILVKENGQWKIERELELER